MNHPNAGTAHESDGDQTIPLVPDGGYAPTEQFPFAEETLVNAPAGDPWAAPSPAPSPGYTTPGYGTSAGASQTGPQPAAPQSNYTQPQAFGSNYTQPQADYGRQAAPQPGRYQQPGFAEPPGPLDGVGPQGGYQGYQGYPGTRSGQQPAWPAVINDPVGYDYGYSAPPAVSEHPNAVMSLILGIVGLAFFQILSPVAWYLAAKGRREMAAYPGRWRPSGALTGGFVLGIIGTVLLGLVIAFVMLMIFLLLFVGRW